MTREEKLIYFKSKGYIYDPQSGNIITPLGKIITYKINGYITISLKIYNKTIMLKAHHLAYYLYYNEIPNNIDHIDRDKTNNKISNLRSVTHHKNMFNRNAKGYHYQNDKYRASIKLNGRKIHLGYYDTAKEAHKIYLEAKKLYHII